MHTFKMTAVAAALLAAYGPALADGPESSVSIGVGNWSNDRPQRGVFDGMRDSGAYGLLDADVSKRDEATGTWLGLKARNLGLDNRELKGEWLRQGDMGGSLEYSRIPRDNQFKFNTSVTGIGTTTQTVPAVGIAAGRGQDVELGTVRDRYTAKFFKNLGVGLNFNASYRHEDKDGTRQWGRGGAPEFAVEPINSTIKLYEATLSYSRDKLQLSGGYYGTSYSNANTLVVTSLSTLAAASYYNLSLPLDNKSHEFFLNGGYDFTPTTRGTFKTSYSRVTQDEALPMSNIAGLVWTGTNAPSALAPRNLDGRLDTTLVEAGLTSKPMPKLSIVANLRYRDFDDKTPVRGIIYTGTTPTVWNTPFSYTNKVGKLEATYKLPQSYSLLGGVEYNAQDRWVPSLGTLYVPFRAKMDETTYRVQLRKSMSETVNGSVAYLRMDRKGGGYTLPGDVNEDVINPINIADRKRDKWRGMLDWSPSDKLGLQFVLEDSQDKYSGRQYGMEKGTGRLYAVDGSYQLNSDWQLTAWVSRDVTEAKETTQRTASSGAADAVKATKLNETGNSFGLGMRGKTGRVKMGGDLEYFRSVNEYKQDLTLLGAGTVYPTSGAIGVVPLPNITNRMTRVKLFAEYAVQKNADVRLNLIHEQWKTDDWSWMMFPATGATAFSYGGATDGTTVSANPKQNSTFVGVSYIYKFQ